MGYRELLDSLARQVEEEKASMIGEADRRGRLILEEVRREIERLETAFAAEDFRDAHLEREKALAQARQEAEIASLLARREAVEKVREQVKARLGALRESPSYRGLMERLIDEILVEMPDVGEWIADRRDVKLVREILGQRKQGGSAKVSEGVDCLGGLAAASPNGRSILYNTLDSRLAKVWSETETGIGVHLAGSGS